MGIPPPRQLPGTAACRFESIPPTGDLQDAITASPTRHAPMGPAASAEHRQFAISIGLLTCQIGPSIFGSGSGWRAHDAAVATPTHQKYGNIKMHTGHFVARFETPSGPAAAASRFVA
jgi:hypothetical protein